jgi:hypothetical protein
MNLDVRKAPRLRSRAIGAWEAVRAVLLSSRNSADW